MQGAMYKIKIRRNIYLIDFLSLYCIHQPESDSRERDRQAKKTPTKGDKSGYKTPHRKGYPLREEKRETE
jgi:hypothetical protein